MNVSKYGALVGSLAIAAGLIMPGTTMAQRPERVGESGIGRVPAGGGRGTGGGAGVGGAAGAMIGGRVGSSVPSGAQLRNNVRGEAYGRPTDSYRRGSSGLDRAADRYDRKWFDDSPDATQRGTDLERAVDRTSQRPEDWIDRNNPVDRTVTRTDRRDTGGLANDPDLVRSNRGRYDDRTGRQLDDRRVVNRPVYDRRSYTFDGRDPNIDLEDRNFNRAGDRVDRNRDRIADRTDRVNPRLSTASDRVARNRERVDDRTDDRRDERRSADDRRNRNTGPSNERRDADDRRDPDDRRSTRDRDTRDTRGDAGSGSRIPPIRRGVDPNPNDDKIWFPFENERSNRSRENTSRTR